MANLNGVDKRLLCAFEKAKEIFESKSDFKVIISQGIRTDAEQLELYKKGRKLIGGKWAIVDRKNVVTYTLKSKHIYGKAIDVAFIKDKKADWTLPKFKVFADIMNEVDSGIVWGGNWESFKDNPHFEI